MKKWVIGALLAATAGLAGSPAWAQDDGGRRGGWRNRDGQRAERPQGSNAQNGSQNGNWRNRGDAGAQGGRDEAAVVAQAQARAESDARQQRRDTQRRLEAGSGSTQGPARQQAVDSGRAGGWSRDRNGDGRVDTFGRDRNRDGRPDTFARDRNGDGRPDTFARDRNGDGRPDTFARDRNGDGRPDTFARDRNGDGRPDTFARDRNGDGRADGFANRGRQNDRNGWNGGRFDNQRFSGNRWNRDWRSDGRYDWNRYRSGNRYTYRLPRYYAPGGWSYGYRRFSIGVTLQSVLWGQNYWIDDPYSYRLPPAYGPYRWVRYYNDALLVDIRSGEVVDTVYDIFWY